MKKWRLVLTLGMLAGLRSVACSGEADVGAGGTTTDEGVCDPYAEAAGWLEGEPVEASAQSTPARISAIGEQTWNQSLKMLAAVPSSRGRNLAQSATSFYAAMGMAYERYRVGHDCGPAIKEALEFPEDGMDLHHSIGAGLRELAAREIPAAEDSDGLTLDLTNSVWALQTTELPEANEIQTIYGATPNAIDSTGEPARALINCIIERDSRGLLVDFLPEGIPDDDTFTADINVAFLAAPWREQMGKGPVDFTPEGGTPAQVDGMRSDLDLAMFAHETFSTVELPLLGDELRVMFVVPNDTFAGTMDEFVGMLTHEMLAEARIGAELRYIDFQMPKVDIDLVTLDYKKELGIECNPNGGLRQVFHGATVKMDEKGIEAAAATVATGGDLSLGHAPPEAFFHIDRPFLFFVHDAATGYALFSGRYLG